MQLTKIEMCGFKSFVHRTEIKFEPGVTGVVGPNGCGKSNIVDAIKWVLGTQSYKAVRGGEMTDVIFKGAVGVAPVGVAEVSLTLDNSDHALPIEFEEVTITRRVHSDGTGEYQINKSPCRLKDIRELLFGTGIGANNYSIIEQGKLSELIKSNPKERRLVFEEAAGISKYRARRKEAQNRLEKVSQDLLRLEDILREVQRELRSVRAQAGRAQRYRGLNSALTEKRRSLVHHEFRQFRKTSAEIAALLSENESRRGELGEELSRVRSTLKEEQDRLSSLEEETTAAAGEMNSLESKAGFLSQSVETSDRRRIELKEERARLEVDLAAISSKLEELSSLTELHSEEKRNAGAERERLQIEREETGAALGQAEEECREVQANLDLAKSEAVENAHKESRYKSDHAQAVRDLEGLEKRKARVQARRSEVEAELETLRAGIGDARATRGSLETMIATMIEEKKGQDGRLAERKSELVEAEKELHGLRQDRDRRSSRQETLRDFELQMEGLDSGAKELLRQGFPGVLGTLADFIEVDSDHLVAVEGALGDLAGAVVCDSVDSASRAIAFVKEQKYGRTMVLARNVDFFRPDSQVELRGMIGLVSEFIRTAPENRIWIHDLLSSMIMVEEGRDARDILSSGLARSTMVTKEGDVFESNGLITTGLKGGVGILSRKTELRRLALEIEDYDRIIAGREARRGELETAVETCNKRIEALRRTVYERSIDRNDADNQIEKLTSRVGVLDGERETSHFELREIEIQGAALEERRGKVLVLLGEIDALKGRLAGEIAGYGMTLARYMETREELARRLTETKVAFAKAEEQIAAIEKQLSMVRDNIGDSTANRGRTESLREDISGRIDSVVEEIRARREEESDLLVEMEKKRESLSVLEKNRASREERVAAVRSESESAAEALAGCEAEIQNARVREGECRVKLESHVTRVREEYEIDLEKESPPGAEEAVDWDLLAQEVEELRVKVQGFGAVNVEALSLLEGLEIREKEYLSQGEDLGGTRKELESLIRRLDKESREIFGKTVDVVREHFKAIFRKLFRGGQADIVLLQEEGVDPMEQGLEIKGCPPGKKLESISLLSGGEKSLTALALTLGLFRANPSPFCILDEADSALDESNLEQYVGIINEFVGETQFIVVTHHKETMAAADVLYGVTMEREGVSKKVTVDLNGKEGLDILRKKKIARRNEHQAKAREEANAMATAVLEADVRLGPGSEEPDPS
jgi:chromosome segregation protein